MVCYYENWSQYKAGLQRMMPADIDPNLCTHIVYSFAKIDRGVLAPTEHNDYSEFLLKLSLVCR